MQFTALNDVTVHYRYSAGDGMPIVFLNSLGTDFRIWDQVIAGLDSGPPTLSLDKRGHGLSDDGPITMDLLISDLAALMDQIALSPALICGVSVGGMIAQGLAAARPDLVAGLVLCCTGARIGDAEGWNARIETVHRYGIASMSDVIMERWFSAQFRSHRTADLAGYRNMLSRTSPAGYAGVCAAIRDTDLTEHSRRLEIPTHCIAGTGDKSTPPELVRELADLIPAASFQLIDQCGHLPSIEAPELVSRAVKLIHEKLA